MRGTPWPSCEDKPHPGIIPAYAGNTTSRAAPCPDAWDHPRVCGEHTGVGAANVTAKGSSPRMRGTPVLRGIRTQGGRIIPAYAGNTGGEGAGHGHASGSSPRMRGTHLVVREVVLMAGIIPAYAGNTRSRTLRLWLRGIIPAYAGNTMIRLGLVRLRRDHPRVCGEHHSLLCW